MSHEMDIWNARDKHLEDLCKLDLSPAGYKSVLPLIDLFLSELEEYKEKAGVLFPKKSFQVRIYKNQAVAKYMSGDNDGALEACETSIRLSIEDVSGVRGTSSIGGVDVYDCYIIKSLIYTRKNDMDKAVEAFTNAGKLRFRK